MSKIKTTLFILFSTISSQEVFCSDLTMSTIFTTDIKTNQQLLQQNLTPDAKAAVRRKALETAKQFHEYQQRKAAQKKMREEYMHQIPEPVKKRSDLIFKEITPDSTKKLKKLIDKDLASTNGTRDAQRLAAAQKHYRDLQQALLLEVLVCSLSDFKEPVAQSLAQINKIEVTKNFDSDGTITYKKTTDK